MNKEMKHFPRKTNLQIKMLLLHRFWISHPFIIFPLMCKKLANFPLAILQHFVEFRHHTKMYIHCIGDCINIH